jgi:hypothetical protein
MDLRSKAEVVLNGLVNKNISTFPALDSNPHDNFGGGGGGGSTSRFGATGTGGGSRRFVSKTQPIANAGANIVSSSADGKRRTQGAARTTGGGSYADTQPAPSKVGRTKAKRRVGGGGTKPDARRSRNQENDKYSDADLKKGIMGLMEKGVRFLLLLSLSLAPPPPSPIPPPFLPSTCLPSAVGGSGLCLHPFVRVSFCPFFHACIGIASSYPFYYASVHVSLACTSSTYANPPPLPPPTGPCFRF